MIFQDRPASDSARLDSSSSVDGAITGDDVRAADHPKALGTRQHLRNRWRRSALGRSPRLVVLIGLAVVLGILALTGRFGVDASTDLSAQEAVEIARPQIDFVPVNEGARFVRQGAGLRPVWAVSFSIPGDARGKFERLTTVEVDARTGEIIRVSRD